MTRVMAVTQRPMIKRIQQPAREQSLVEQIAEVLEGRRFVEPERDIGDVVEVGVRLERRDQHPIERKRGEDEEESDRADRTSSPDAAFSTLRAACQISRRRMKRSITDHHDEQYRQHEQRDGGAVRYVAGNDAGLETREAQDRGCAYRAAHRSSERRSTDR